MIYKNATVVCEEQIIENGFIEFENGLITNIGKNYEGDAIDLQGKIIMPGFIDGHIHGAIGHDFMDGDAKKMDEILNYLPSEGVTSILATTMTQQLDIVKNVVETISNHQHQLKQTKIQGIHLEGPFINQSKSGAQNTTFITNPSIDDLKYIDPNLKNIKVVTYAPELDSEFEFTKFLVENNIRGSLGHTNANSCECNKSFEIGVNRVTHLYNAMKPFHHRDIGLVNSAFLNKMLCEIIVDKIHIDPDVVKVTYQYLSSKNLILITDAMRAKGLGDGEYDLGGQTVHVKNGEARLIDGSLAGSTLKYNIGVKNLAEITSCNLLELSKMTSVNQAKDLNLNTGILKEGYCADFVILDENLNIIDTVIDGNSHLN